MQIARVNFKKESVLYLWIDVIEFWGDSDYWQKTTRIGKHLAYSKLVYRSGNLHFTLGVCKLSPAK